MTLISQPEIIHEIRTRCVANDLIPDANQVTEIIRELKPGLTQLEILELTDETLSAFHGLGPLEELVSIPGITDILVNGPNEVLIDRGMGLELTRIKWQSESDLRNYASRIAELAHRRLDDSQPFVDLRLSNGFRFHAMIPPISICGTMISIRIPIGRTMTMNDLVSTGMVLPEAVGILQSVISSRVSFLIAGGTGTGKTTLLGAMLAITPDTERILVVEDSAELAISHPYAATLQSRNSNIENLGEVTMQTLVRQALRMRPDRLVIGEVRGIEIVDFLNALNTGHSGSGSTIHANSAKSVPTRVEALGLIAGMPRAAIHSQLVSAIQVVLELRRDAHGKRKLTNISILKILDTGFVTAASAVNCSDTWQPDVAYNELMQILGIDQ